MRKVVNSMRSDSALVAPVEATRVTQCRACGSDDLREFLTLGSTPVANDLVDPTDPAEAPAYPLSVGFCASCALVQLTHELPAEAIFGADYPYFSSFSDDLVAHSRDHVHDLVESRRLGAESLVVELASNDGYLLRHFLPHQVPVLGVEPTPGPAEAARDAGVPTVGEFFTTALGRELREKHGKADVVLAKNVMAHVPDLNGFVAGMAALVADDGIIQVENPSVQYLVENVEFDTVYHEHFCYFSTIAVERLFRRHGLYLHDVEYFPQLHGGTLRWTGGKTDARTSAVDRRIAEETAAGIGGWAAYRDFGRRVAQTQSDLRATLERVRAEGSSIAAYGAAAKGATLLNTCGIGGNVIDFVVDRSPMKQGKLMPGVRIPVVDPSELLARRPDYVLLLAWNFRDEILRQQQEYREAGGRFIVPAPVLEVL